MASASYHHLQRDAATKDLFNKRITTLEGFYSSVESSSFIAIDTEHVAVSSQQGRILLQVGVVYVPALLSPHSTPLDVRSENPRRRSLQDFYSQCSGQALTINISISKQDRDRLTLHRGEEGFPKRRATRFGLEKTAPVEDVEESLLEFFRGLPDQKPLVLLGFELAAEWAYLSSVFPGIMRFLSAWVDVRDIANDIASSAGYKVLPSLSVMLPMFDYSAREFFSSSKDQERSGNSDNASEDAVASCALAHALLLRDNQSKLVFYQKCNKIAQPRTKKSRYQMPSQWDGFSAMIYTEGSLPRIFKAGNRIAGHFFEYSPTRAGIMSQDTMFLTFSTEDERQYFIDATNGQSVPTGEVLKVQAYSRPENVVKREMEMQNSKRQLRKAKRSEADAASCFTHF